MTIEEKIHKRIAYWQSRWVDAPNAVRCSIKVIIKELKLLLKEVENEKT